MLCASGCIQSVDWTGGLDYRTLILLFLAANFCFLHPVHVNGVPNLQVNLPLVFCYSLEHGSSPVLQQAEESNLFWVSKDGEGKGGD